MKDEDIPKSFGKFKNDMFQDFTTMDNVDNWYEVSDIVRVPGKSKVYRHCSNQSISMLYSKI